MTNDPALAQKMLLFRSHGITRDPLLMTQVPKGHGIMNKLLLGTITA